MDVNELKPLVTSPHWPLLVEYLQELENLQVNVLVNSKDEGEIRVIQGRILQIRQIKSLDKRVTSFKP